MIYKGTTAKVAYKGYYKPVKVYKGSRMIAGWINQTQTGESASFEGTYDDTAAVSVEGNSEQAVTVQGKNLFDKSINPIVTGDWNQVTNAWYEEGAVSITRYLIPVKPSTTYTHSSTAISGQIKIRKYWDINRKYISTAYGDTFTTPINCYYITIQWNSISNTQANQDLLMNSLQLELGSTATAYEPFVPDSPSPDYPSAVNSAEGSLLVNSEVVSAMPTLRKIGTVADEWNTVTGEVTRRIGIASLSAGTEWTINDAKNNSAYMCTYLPQGTLTGQTLTATIGQAFTLYYELATPATETVTAVPIATYPKQTTIGQDSTVKASITATAKVIYKGD